MKIPSLNPLRGCPLALLAVLASVETNAALSLGEHQFDRTPALATGPAGLKISGFIDPQAQLTSNPNVTKGFVLNDAALYFEAASETTSVLVDLPFRMYT